MQTRVITEPAPVFIPKRIEITFDTQKELDAFTALMNYTPVTDALEQVGGFDTICICDVCETIGGHPSGPHHQEIDQIVKKHPGITSP